MQAIPTHQNLQKLFQVYLEQCQYATRLRPETIRSSREAFRHFTSLVPEVILVRDAIPESIILFFKRLQIRERSVGKGDKRVGVKDSTIQTYGGRLKTFFKWMVEKGHMSSNPFDEINLPRPRYSDHRALKGEEIKKIMGSVAQYSQNPFLLKRDMAIIGMLTFCGLRRNELLALEIRDIDVWSGLIVVRGETSKSKITRKIPINLHLRLYLSEYLEERKKRNSKSPYFFLSQNADLPLTHHGLKHWVERLSKLSGVKFHVHRFRHTFATNLAMQDVGVAKIQRLMGHSDIKMTSAYLRSISTENMQEDVNKLSFECMQ